MDKLEKRLNIDFDEEEYKVLEELQKKLLFKSKSELIRQSLGVVRWIAEQALDQENLLLLHRPTEGTTKEVVFSFIERVRSQGDVSERPVMVNINSPKTGQKNNGPS
jgi:hypothetical protein